MGVNHNNHRQTKTHIAVYYYPTIFYGARETEVEGLIEVSGMKLQPYEKTGEELLKELTDEQLKQEIQRRQMKS